MRRVFFYLAVIVAVSASANAYDWNTNPGDGTPENPFQISTPEHLMSIGSDSVLVTKHYILTNDIAFDPNNNPAHVFTKALIAPVSDGDDAPVFSGSFDGNHYKIINLKIISETNNASLFRHLVGENPNDILVQDLTLVNPDISGLHSIAPLAGLIETCKIENSHVIGGKVSSPEGTAIGGLIAVNYCSIISHCSSSAEVRGDFRVGGLAGGNLSALIINSSASGNVTGGFGFVGGLVGDLGSHSDSELFERNEIVNCYASGNVEANKDCGGLVGYASSGLIQNCSSTGAVNGLSNAGGLVGRVAKDWIFTDLQMVIDCCHSSGDVPVNYEKGGGLVGAIQGGHIQNCSAEGIVEGESSLGGLVGYIGNMGGIDHGPTTISRCYASGNVEGQESCLGGLVGTSDALLIRDCYAVGNVQSLSGEYVGGLIGYNNNQVVCCFSTGLVSENAFVGGLIGYSDGDTLLCYWDKETSQTTQSAGGISKMTEEMMSVDTYQDWDFVGESVNGDNDIWRMCVDGVAYPRLSWEFAKDGDFACADGVDFSDLEALAECWLLSEAIIPASFSYACDANGDGVVDLADFAVLSENWP